MIAARGLKLAVTFALAFGADAAWAGKTGFDQQGVLLLDGQRAFTIGLSKAPPLGSVTPDGGDPLAEFVGAGATVFRVDPLGPAWTEADLAHAQSWMDALAARGGYAWLNLRDLNLALPGSERETLLVQAVQTLGSSPGLAMWKGSDEPWWSKYPPGMLEHAYRTVKAHDPDHVSVVIQAARGKAADLAPYAAVTDVHGVDPYPVRYGIRNPDLHAVGRWTRRLRSITPSRAVFVTLQICIRASENPDGSGDFVLPTRKQKRYMIYDAIMNGARGLFFFGGQSAHCLRGEDAALGWNWTYWESVLEGLIREIGPGSEFYPALLHPGTGIGLQSSSSLTQVRSRRVGDEVWVMAARRGTGHANVTIRGLPASVASVDVYAEGRSIPVRKGAFTDRFGQWAVHVYRFSL